MPRLALGLAVLAVERVNPGPVGHAGLDLAVGLASGSAAQVRALAGAVAAPAGVAARRMARMPGARALAAPLGLARDRLSAVAAQARQQGAGTVNRSRAEALWFMRAALADSTAFAQREVIPPIVDGLVPHLVEQTMPRLIDGALPAIRAQIMPVIVDDLAADPKLRDLVTEQGRGLLGEAALELRESTASADDRVESAFRRLLRRPSVPAGGA